MKLNTEEVQVPVQKPVSVTVSIQQFEYFKNILGRMSNNSTRDLLNDYQYYNNNPDHYKLWKEMDEVLTKIKELT